MPRLAALSPFHTRSVFVSLLGRYLILPLEIDWFGGSSYKLLPVRHEFQTAPSDDEKPASGSEDRARRKSLASRCGMQPHLDSCPKCPFGLSTAWLPDSPVRHAEGVRYDGRTVERTDLVLRPSGFPGHTVG